MEYDIRPTLKPELKPEIKEQEREGLIQVNDILTLSDDSPNFKETNHYLEKAIGINVYIDENSDTKYIGKEIADDFKISDLMNPTIRQYKLFYKVTDEMISKIVEYYEMKEKIKITIEYKKLPPKNNFTNEGFENIFKDDIKNNHKGK